MLTCLACGTVMQGLADEREYKIRMSSEAGESDTLSFRRALKEGRKSWIILYQVLYKYTV